MTCVFDNYKRVVSDYSTWEYRQAPESLEVADGIRLGFLLGTTLVLFWAIVVW